MTDPADKHPRHTADVTGNYGQEDDLATTRRLFMSGVAASTAIGSTAAIGSANNSEPADSIGYGEGTYGDGGFGGVAVEPELALSIDGPAQTTVGRIEIYEVEARNDGDQTPENVWIEFKLTSEGGIEPSNVSIEYHDGGDWQELDLTIHNGSITGAFGPDEGFPIPDGYIETIDIRATFHEADVYTLTVTAVGVDNQAEYATATNRVSVALEPVAVKRVDLIAGRHLNVGEVIVRTDPGSRTLAVTYESADGWSIEETHLAVGRNLDEFDDEDWVNSRGLPRPGRFPYSGSHGSNDSVTYKHDMTTSPGGAEPGETLLIAGHAVVTGEAGREGAWADGDRFVLRGNWATLFEYEVEV